MSENTRDEIEDILTRINEKYDISAQDVAAKLRISSVHLSRVRHGSRGEKAEQSLLSKLRKLADEYGLFVEPSPEVAYQKQQQLQLAQEMEQDAYHPALIQAAYRRLGLDSNNLGWANVFMGKERLDEIVVQLGVRQHIASQHSRQQSQIRTFAQPKAPLRLPQQRSRQRIQEPSQQLQIEAPKQQVTVTEVETSLQEAVQSLYSEMSDHRK